MASCEKGVVAFECQVHRYATTSRINNESVLASIFVLRLGIIVGPCRIFAVTEGHPSVDGEFETTGVDPLFVHKIHLVPVAHLNECLQFWDNRLRCSVLCCVVACQGVNNWSYPERSAGGVDHVRVGTRVVRHAHQSVWHVRLNVDILHKVHVRHVKLNGRDERLVFPEAWLPGCPCTWLNENWKLAELQLLL